MIKNSIILKEGIKPIFISLFITIICAIFISSSLATILAIITIFIAFMYRDKNIDLKRNDSEILSICDGTINTIDYNKTQTILYINVTPFNNHILISPIDANLKILKYKNGLNLNPNSFKANKLNEQLVIAMNDIEIEFLSGVCNNKINIQEKEFIKGDKLGVFLNGIIKITFNSNNIKLNVNIGDKIQSGQTVIAFTTQG